MTNELPQIRASDAERERVAEMLRDAMATGRLALDEFQERLDRAYSARTRGELEPLVRDLPQSADPARPDEPVSRGGWAGRIGGRATSRLGIGVLGGFVRKGPWTAPRRFTSFTYWGGGQIDLREARFEEREVVIRCIAVMGGAQVVVPQDAEVEVRGIGIMGGFDHSATGAGKPGAPRIVITGFAFWGGVGTERKPTDEERARLRAERKRKRKKLEGPGGKNKAADRKGSGRKGRAGACSDGAGSDE